MTITGFNTNITYDGKTFHVQTEVIGEINPTVETLVYQGGTIVHSLKTPSSRLDDNTSELGIAQFAEQQHNKLLYAIRQGRLAKELDARKDNQTSHFSIETEYSNWKSERSTTKIPLGKSDDFDEIPDFEEEEDQFELSEADENQENFQTENEEKQPIADEPAGDKYMKGTEIAHSGFLKKIREQTEKMKALKQKKEESGATDNKTVELLLTRILKSFQDIDYCAYYSHATLSTAHEINDEKLNKILIQLSAYLGKLEKNIERNWEAGPFKENFIVTEHYSILSLQVKDYSYLLLVAKTPQQLLPLRNVLKPFIDMFQKSIQ